VEAVVGLNQKLLQKLGMGKGPRKKEKIKERQSVHSVQLFRVGGAIEKRGGGEIPVGNMKGTLNLSFRVREMQLQPRKKGEFLKEINWGPPGDRTQSKRKGGKVAQKKGGVRGRKIRKSGSRR